MMTTRRAVRVLLDRLSYLELQLKGEVPRKARDRIAEEASALRWLLKQHQAELTAEALKK